MRRTFWPNRIFQRFGAKNRSTGLKFTRIRQNSRLSIKIVQNVLFTLCVGRFGQIAFRNVLDPKIALLDWSLRQYVRTVGFLSKLYKTCFSGHVEDVSVKSHFQRFGANNRSSGLKLRPISENSRLSMKRAFIAMRRTFWPNCICQRFRSKNRSTALKFTPIRENSRLSMKIVQNVLFRPRGGRFGENAFSTSRRQQSLYRTEIHANTWKQ